MDEKGRLAIPARFREVLRSRGDNCLVLTNYDNCLWAFARDDWKVIELKAAKLPKMDPKVQSLYRYFISGAQECGLKQGRITIPPDLRDIMGLKKEVVLVGGLEFFEIWDKEKWEEEFEKTRASFPEVSQSLSGIGL